MLAKIPGLVAPQPQVAVQAPIFQAVDYREQTSELETLPPLPDIQNPQIEMPQAREQALQKPVLPRDALLAKVRAFRESQTAQHDAKFKKQEPVQLSMPVNSPEMPVNNSNGPDLDTARKLAREMGRQFDEKTYDIPAFIRKNQRPHEPQV